jgi:sugar lactone lactonase YvrE
VSKFRMESLSLLMKRQCTNCDLFSNLISFSYYIDSPLKRVDAFDYNKETGDWTNRRTVIHIENGYPDGMTIDKEGNLWISHWAGGCVTRWNPKTGKLLRTVKMPVSKVTSCAFGGKVSKLNKKI